MPALSPTIPSLSSLDETQLDSHRLPSSTTILSLAPELIEIILSSCTDASLLALSQTCTSLHVITLHTFFKWNNMGGVMKGWLSASNPPRETLEAVRVALFLKQLSSVTWEFIPGWECSVCIPRKEDGRCPFCRLSLDYRSRIETGPIDPRIGPLKRTHDEVDSLRAIIARLLEIGMVSLDFHAVGFRSFQTDNIWRNDPNRGQDVWRRKLSGLLNEVLDKGCHTLKIEGLNNLYTGLGQTSYSEEMIAPFKGWRHLKLKNMSVHSDTLLDRQSFYNWTFSLLSSSGCTATLTHLSFQLNFIRIPLLLLTSLNLPNLVDFEVQTMLLVTDKSDRDYVI